MNIKASTRQYWPTVALFVALIVVWQLTVSVTFKPGEYLYADDDGVLVSSKPLC